MLSKALKLIYDSFFRFLVYYYFTVWGTTSEKGHWRVRQPKIRQITTPALIINISNKLGIFTGFNSEMVSRLIAGSLHKTTPVSTEYDNNV